MSSRRDFAGGLVTALLGAAGLQHVPRAGGRPLVEAVPTIFHGHPDGQTTLVRFVASGIDASAGRLRVLDPGGRLVGTAGMLRRGDALLGELWLPLIKPITIQTRLETPVTRGVLHSTHRINPTPRLTLCWLTIVDSDSLEAHAREVPVLARGVAAAVLHAAGVRANPWSPPGAGGRDHLDLLRAAIPAARAQVATGVAVSRIALVDAAQLEPFIGAALAGAGAEALLRTTQVVAPGVLGFGEGRGVMARRIEQWLTAEAETDRPSAVVVGTDPAFAERAVAAVEEWNGTYAYPRILVGDGDAALTVARRHGGAGAPAAVADPPMPTAARPPADVFRPLARAISPGTPTLSGIAERFGFPVSGVLVFNPSPFGQSAAVAMPDGTTRVVTDVPGIGYAFVPGGHADGAAGAAGAPERWTGGEIAAARSALDLRRDDGAIVSLADRVTGHQLVRPGGCLNGLDAAVLSEATVERLPGVGVRIRARRVTPREVVVSTMTLYDALPWVDITNTTEEGGAGGGGVSWSFDIPDGVEEVRWDVAGGSLAAEPPVARFTPLRWLALRRGSSTVLLAVRGASGMSFDGARLTVRGSGGGSAPRAATLFPVRFRLAGHLGYLLPDDPWRFGFSLESLIPVAASGRGDRRLATFGRLLDVPDPAVAVVGVKPADDDVGVVAYLMDLAGLARTVAVRPGALGFDGAMLTDLAERDQRPANGEPGGGVFVPVPERGYAAVRLLGVRLA